MGKVKEIFRGPNRRFAWFVVITTTLFVLLWVIGPGNTIGHWIRAIQEDKEQQKEIARYKKANEELDRKIENQIQFLAHDRKVNHIRLRVSPYVAAFLKQGFLSLCRRWMWRYRVRIDVIADQSLGMIDVKYLDKNDTPLIEY